MHTAPTMNRPIANTSPPSAVMKIAKAIAGSATMMRAPRSERRRRRRRCGDRRRGSEAIGLARPETPAALFELLERGLEVRAVEVRPEGVRKNELRIGALPEQEVRDAALAARADQEVGICHLGRVQVAGELFLAAPFI